MAVLGVFFQHLYTSVNDMEKRDINIRDVLFAIRPFVAHLHSHSDGLSHSRAPRPRRLDRRNDRRKTAMGFLGRDVKRADSPCSRDGEPMGYS
jgi:hypothetical protein